MFRWLVLSVVLFASPALSQTNQEADRLFDDGRQLVHQGKYAEACPKFAEAQRLRPGVGTLLNLADCYERQGKTASASQAFLDAVIAAEAANDERAALARSRIESLEARLVKLLVVVAEESDVDGLEVSVDGRPLTRDRWGSETPVDPGTYTIAASAPGRPAWSKRVDVLKGSVRVVVSFVQAAPRAEAPQRPVPDQEPEKLSTQRIVALGVASVGVIGIGVGAGFGLASLGAKKDADDHCGLGPSGDQCDSTGKDAGDRAISRGNVATVAFVLGSVAVATGTVLWLTAPTQEKKPRVGLVPFGVRGVF